MMLQEDLITDQDPRSKLDHPRGQICSFDGSVGAIWLLLPPLHGDRAREEATILAKMPFSTPLATSSSGGPFSTRQPLSITSTRSLSMMVSMRWAMTTSVASLKALPSSLLRSIA